MDEEMKDVDLEGKFFIPLVFLMIVSIGFGFAMGGLAFKDNVKEIIQKEAIENQCGQYNPITGNFEWIKR
jgi:hypothetical protein